MGEELQHVRCGGIEGSGKGNQQSVGIYSVVGCALLLTGVSLETGSLPPPLPRSSASARRKVKRRPFFSRMIVDWAEGDTLRSIERPLEASPAVPRAKRMEV